MKLVEEWKKELPCQFQGKVNLSAIIDAVGKQITGLETVFADLKEKTDIRYAAGKNLDMIGDIVGITRLEAISFLRSRILTHWMMRPIGMSSIFKS